MVKINRRLLPMKAHFFFFMAAMGPILPQLSVLGKQIGITPEVMGCITSVLPIMYVIAKPLFGFIADYFTVFRKMIFIGLIAVMTLSYGAFYFVPPLQTHAIAANATWNASFADFTHIEVCAEEMTSQASLCTMTRPVQCHGNNTDFNAYIVASNSKSSTSDMNLIISSSLPSSAYMQMCFTSKELNISATSSSFQGSCYVAADLQPGCLYSSSTFWLFVIFMCAGTIGFNVANSISDAICFDMLGESDEDKYGAQRVWGTIGFGLSALIGGVIVDFWTLDAVKSFTPALIVMFIFGGFDLFSASTLKLPAFSSSESIFKDVWALVTHPSIAIFLVFATMAGIIDSFIIYFMFWHLEEVAASTGYMDQIKLIEGCVVAAECLAGEVPFFFYSGKIIKKLGYVHCMSLCFFFYAVRLGLISWIPNPWYLVGVELFFQGVTYALCYTCIVAYAAAVAPPGTSATVQGLMAGMDDGLGFSIGSLTGGYVFKRYGGRNSFLYFSILALCTCVAHILLRPTSRKQQYLPRSGGGGGYQLPMEQMDVVGVTSNQPKYKTDKTEQL